MKEGSRLKISNGKIITPTGIRSHGTVLIADGVIDTVSAKNVEVPGALEIDAKGKYISPGFIDIHVHGGGGHDFMDNSVEAFLAVAKAHAKHGTTSFTPTTLTSEKQDLLDTLTCYDQANEKNVDGATFIGMHLEGPYFAVSQRGAQDPRYIRDPDPNEYRDLVPRFKSIKRWSAAPELKGALEFGRYMTSHGVMPAIAHTDALYDDVVEAYKNGFSHLTHFYSCMNGVTRRNAFRYAGVIEAGYLMDDVTVEIIADGVHLPPPLLKLIYKIKGPDKIALITDAMRGAGMPPGESILGGLKNGLNVIIEDGVAKLPDRTAFAGSVATTDRLVRNMISMAEVSVEDAIKMMTLTPATIMKVSDRKGSIEPGKDADIVIFDDGISIDTTIIHGKIVYAV